MGEGGNHGVLGAVGITVWMVERGPYVLEANAGENIGAVADGVYAPEVRAMPHGLRFDSSDSRLSGASSVFNTFSASDSESNSPDENGNGGIMGLGVPFDFGRVCEFDLESGGGVSREAPMDGARGSGREVAEGVRLIDPLVANMVEYDACTGAFPPRMVPPPDLGVDGKRLTVSVLTLGVL
jgi:hypothetical protein